MENDATACMLIFRETTPGRYAEMSDDERRAALERWNAWGDDLAASGRLRHGHPLHDGGRIVSAAGSGEVLDGPFAEAKELIGGYLLLDVADVDEAVAIARTCPNLRYGMTVEVRPVAPACHLARSLGWETMRAPAGA